MKWRLLMCSIAVAATGIAAADAEKMPLDEDYQFSNKVDTPLPYPLPPRGVKAATVDSKSVALAWRPPFDSRDVAAYHVYRDFKLVAKCSRNSRAWRDSKVTPGKTYRYHVLTVNKAGKESAVPGIFAYNGYQSAHGVKVWEKIMAKPWISGVTFSFFWKDLEPEKGKFNWKYLDDVIALAAKHGKTVGLWPYLPAPWLPDWMKGRIGTYDLNKTRTKSNIPYMLDPVLIKEYNEHLAAIAKRYNGNPNVHYVLVSLSGTSGMHNNVTPAPVQFDLLRKKFNYTVDAHIKAWQDTFKYYEKIFPDTRWGYGLHYTNEEMGPAMFVSDWALKKYGSKVVLFNEGLNGQPWMRLQWQLNGWQLNSEYIADQVTRTTVGYQMLGQSWGPKGPNTGTNGPLDKVLENAGVYDANFLEIWTHDINEPAFEAQLDAEADRLGLLKVTIPQAK